SAELFNMVSFTAFKTRVVNTNFDFQIKVTPTNSINLQQNLIYQRNKQIDQSDNQLMNINLISRTKFEWFATKKFTLDFVFDVLHNRPDQQSSTTILFADLNSKYQWSSKLSTFVTCRNLFNQSAFTFNRITGFESNVSSFPLLERFLQLGLSLKL
nr:TonB-dependent receptor [Sediminibacterium sp.]